MKRKQFRQLLLSMIVLSSISNAQGHADREYVLSLAVRCPQKEFKQGDEIPIVFTITNNDPAPYTYDLRKGDRSGRVREYALFATRLDGTKVPDPRENYVTGLGGGLSSGLGTIATGQSFNKTIALNRWARIKEPGRYNVVGTYSYSVPASDVKGEPNVRYTDIIQIKSAPIEVVVTPRNHRQMGQYIKNLVEDLKAIKPSRKWDIVQRREAIIAKLAYTCDSRIVPTLIDLMYSNYHNNEVFEARHAFLCYLPDDPKIKDALLQAAMTRGLAPGMQSPLEKYGCTEQQFKKIISDGLTSNDHDILGQALMAAQEHPDDEHMPRLIAIALGTAGLSSDHDLATIHRGRAISAIACNRTDEGVKALRALLKHPDQKIRRSTQGSIRWAYRRHPIYPIVLDYKLTVELSVKALNTSDRRYVFAIMEICRSRTKEGVEALKMLAEDPDLDLPILRTDAGVRAIRDLLRSPDKNVREATSHFIKSIYEEYPGRPLKADDFPEELQKPRPRERND